MCLNIYEQILYASIKGWTSSSGDKGALLVRVMVSRAEVDMDEIQRVFKKKHGIELRDAISSLVRENHNIPSETSGDYTDFLFALASKSK